MRGYITLLLFLFSLSFAIEESQIDPSLIHEEIQTNCPSDPTFGGTCYLVDTQIIEGQECREIKGVRICRDWWKKAYKYSCNGNLSLDTLLSGIEGYEYCTYERKCNQWTDVEKNGGIVSCRVYYDKNKPNCDSNPYRAECITDDCGELFKKCQLLNYTSYSDIKDKANLENTTYCDPVSGMCGYQSVPSTSGVAVGIYTFKCPKGIRKVCTSEEVIKKCPNGTTTVCNTTNVCVRWKSSTTTGKTVKSCIATRKYKEYEVIKGTQEAETYKNNPLCIKVGEKNEQITTKAIFSWGWDGDGGDDCSSCESYVTGLQIEGLNIASKNCFKVSGSSGVFPSSSDLVSYLNNILNQNGLSNLYTVVDVDLNNKLELGTDANPNDGTCFGDDDPPGNNKDYEVPITIATVKEVYRCYENALDTSNCNNLSQNCSILSSLSNLEELECYNMEIDKDNPTKVVCTEFGINYECPQELNLTDCEEWQTKVVCNDKDLTIPELELKGYDFSEDFKKAIAFAQAVNELKHVWSGEPKKCESGWWNSIVENPTEYFINKMVSMAIAYVGSKAFDVAHAIASGASTCLAPSRSNFDECFYTVAKEKYNEVKDKGIAQQLLCGGKGNQSDFCDKLTFLSNPWVQFGISLAMDIITSTDKCNSCTSERCAAAHNDYQEYVLISKGLCHFVASKCTWKIDLGIGKICLRKGYKYCCYDSKFARILVEQAYKQLGYSWGDWDNPNCSALTFDDLKKLDFSRMDFSELVQEIQAKMQYKLDKNYIENKIKDFYGNTSVKPSGEVPWR